MKDKIDIIIYVYLKYFAASYTAQAGPLTAVRKSQK